MGITKSHDSHEMLNYIMDDFQRMYYYLYSRYVDMEKDQRCFKFQEYMRKITTVCDDIDIEMNIAYRCAKTRNTEKQEGKTGYIPITKVLRQGLSLPNDVTSFTVTMRARLRFLGESFSSDKKVFKSERFVVQDNVNSDDIEKIKEIEKTIHITSLDLMECRGAFNFNEPKNLNV